MRAEQAQPDGGAARNRFLCWSKGEKRLKNPGWVRGELQVALQEMLRGYRGAMWPTSRLSTGSGGGGRVQIPAVATLYG